MQNNIDFDTVIRIFWHSDSDNKYSILLSPFVDLIRLRVPVYKLNVTELLEYV